MRLGIPRGLLFYRYFPLWESFFESLEVEVILSSPTTEKTIQTGSKLLPGDLCLPVKIFLGHTVEIKEEVDFLFIPRYISIESEAYMCPKLIGLPDMVKAVVHPLPPLIDLSIHCKAHGKNSEHDFYLKIGKIFTKSKERVEKAFQEGKERENRFFHFLQRGFSFEEAIELSRRENFIPKEEEKRTACIGVVGRPYYIHDSFLKASIINEIQRKGFHLLTPEFWEPRAIETVAEGLKKKIYWSFGKEMVGAAIRFLEKSEIVGIILLASFGCGQDSFNLEMIHHLIKERIPFLSLIFDEHLSRASFSTRIEAFLELIQRQGKNT